MGRLPAAVRQEIEDLPRHYQVEHQAVRERVILTVRVRGIPVTMTLDATSYPSAPPELEIGDGWSWEAADGPQIRRLDSLERWNRTLGLSGLLRELEQRFRQLPPRQGRSRDKRSIVEKLRRWWRGLVERFRRQKAPVAPADAQGPEALREIYDTMISDNTGRVHRYQKALAQLMSQWRRKTERLEGLRGEIQDLEEQQTEARQKAEAIVDRLRGTGQDTEAIRADPDYLRVRASYEEAAADLSEAQERAEKLGADAEEHLGKIQRHEAQLEKLMDELEDLKDEAAEVITDMTLVELEKEIVDVRAGITHHDLAEELGELRRQLRKKRAAVRVTREAAADDEMSDELYLEVADKMSAAREFEQTLGIDEKPPARPDKER